ncbi:MAG: pteridine reductase [Gammaproteobacteria bacterium]|nr:pteridine reductase [Gammaproteobacteria bacterium]NKB64130.1 pteridine reductase [Gammaproteobacteria bacterium]
MGVLKNKVILITGAAKRIGACTARLLHAQGANLILHYGNSEEAALKLQEELCNQRASSVRLIKGDLAHINKIKISIRHTLGELGRLDALINNASSFFPTPIASTTEDQWQKIFDANLKAPFFLAQTTAPYLKKSNGSIINIVDIYAQRPLQDHPVYSASKAGLASLTQSLAAELGPEIRVNGVSPGAILWPESNADEVAQQRMISRTPLKRVGDPGDIANTILFLLTQAPFITGQIINVDGGRTVIP